MTLPSEQPEREQHIDFLERFDRLPMLIEVSRRSGNPDWMRICAAAAEQTENVNPGQTLSLSSLLKLMQSEGRLSDEQASQLFTEPGKFDMSIENWAYFGSLLGKKAVIHLTYDGGDGIESSWVTGITPCQQT